MGLMKSVISAMMQLLWVTPLSVKGNRQAASITSLASQTLADGIDLQASASASACKIVLKTKWSTNWTAYWTKRGYRLRAIKYYGIVIFIRETVGLPEGVIKFMA